uniref:Uncharacterized protein n=1 Tax=Panagrolaimus sp. PS1159 TaxID=55785 RepID=A0AC35F0P2_9BILA
MEFNFPLNLVANLNTLTSPTKNICVLELYEALASEPKVYDEIVYEPEYIRIARQLKTELQNCSGLIHRILADVQPYKVTTYEIERSVNTLDEISKNAQYFSKKVNQISVFMPSNLPLYSFLLFGVIPSFMVKQKLIIKPNQLMRDKMIFEQLYDALNIKNLFTNIETVNSETQKFIEQYVPDSDIVFLGFLHDAEVEKIKCGGNIDMRAKIVQPTVVSDKLTEDSNLEEVFGPISFVYSYEHDDDVAIYFNDKNGTYLRNKMYVSLYGNNEYVEQRDDTHHPTHGGIGIVLYDKNVHDHEEGHKSYGGYSLGASGVFFKNDETNYQSRAMPIYVPEVVALHSEQKLFPPKSNPKEIKKAKKTKNAAIAEPFKSMIKESFGNNLVFGFMYNNAEAADLPSNVFVCVRESILEQGKAFEAKFTKLLQVEGHNFNITVIEKTELDNIAINCTAIVQTPFNEIVVDAMAGSKSAAIGDMSLLSNLTSKINKTLKGSN